MQSVPITIDVVSCGPAHGELYSFQHYVIKLVRKAEFIPILDNNRITHFVLIIACPFKYLVTFFGFGVSFIDGVPGENH